MGKFSLIAILGGALATVACTQTKPLDEVTAREILQSALRDSTEVLSDTTISINTEVKAVQFAETMLFNTYGKRQIVGQKPYNIANVDGYWVITGTVNAQFGGAFEIVFSSRDGRIVRLTHYK